MHVSMLVEALRVLNINAKNLKIDLPTGNICKDMELLVVYIAYYTMDTASSIQ